MEDRCRAGGDELVGAEEQYGRYAAADQGDHAQRGQAGAWDGKALTLHPGQQRQRRQGQQIAQENQRHGCDPVCVNIFCHKRHTAEYNCAENGVNIAFVHLGFHSYLLSFSNALRIILHRTAKVKPV